MEEKRTSVFFDRAMTENDRDWGQSAKNTWRRLAEELMYDMKEAGISSWERARRLQNFTPDSEIWNQAEPVEMYRAFSDLSPKERGKAITAINEASDKEEAVTNFLSSNRPWDAPGSEESDQEEGEEESPVPPVPPAPPSGRREVSDEDTPPVPSGGQQQRKRNIPRQSPERAAAETAAAVRRGRDFSETLSLKAAEVFVSENKALFEQAPVSDPESVHRRAAQLATASQLDLPEQEQRRLLRASQEDLDRTFQKYGEQGTVSRAQMDKIQEAASRMRRASEFSVVSADKSGELAKPYAEQQLSYSGQTAVETEEQRSMSRDVEAAVGISGREYRPALESAAALSSRYGVDSSDITTGEQALEFRRRAAGAELLAGGREGKDRAEFLRNAMQMPTDRMQEQLQERGISTGALQSMEKTLQREGAEAWQAGQARRKEQKERDRLQGMSESYAGVRDLSGVMSALGLSMEEVIEPAVPGLKQVQDADRESFERGERLTARASALKQTARPPDREKVLHKPDPVSPSEVEPGYSPGSPPSTGSGQAPSEKTSLSGEELNQAQAEAEEAVEPENDTEERVAVLEERIEELTRQLIDLAPEGAEPLGVA